ncbi:MAG TPA: glycosyltransferase family 4 protein [Methylocystis sp.]|nr:glycosyltransferase family 4 protein [Methylocystis sp.]
MLSSDPSRPAPLSQAPPLAGRRIALVHPAWHSCGTYRVVLGQLAAYRALGAEVSPIAVSSDPGFSPQRDWIWRGFKRATPEIDAGERHFAGAPFRAVLDPHFLKTVLWPYIHGDQAVIRTGMAERAALSPELRAKNFDLVHCNHFFLMPVAERLAHKRAKILLDSHDLQARQFALMNERMPWLKPHVRVEAMLAEELAQMRKADLLVHLNAEEAEEFRALLPKNEHALLYPAVPAAPTGPGGEDIVIVSSNNSANVESAIWFLREVAPSLTGLPIKIAGSVDAGVKARAGELYARYKEWFLGRVDDPGEIYACAKLVLLPTIDGHGLSIKTVEAMASGLPLVATTLALRGMSEAALRLEGVRIADRPQDFAEAVKRAAAQPARRPQQRLSSAMRAFYDAHFSSLAYEKNLLALIAPLLPKG